MDNPHGRAHRRDHPGEASGADGDCEGTPLRVTEIPNLKIPRTKSGQRFGELCPLGIALRVNEASLIIRHTLLRALEGETRLFSGDWRGVGQSDLPLKFGVRRQAR